MATPSIKQLEAFWWAANCSNFATAAERVHLSVSSLSKRVSELEVALGQPLFDRSGHRATLTDAGQRLLPSALEVLNAMASLKQSLDAGAALSGRCRFGVGDLSALTWLPLFVAAARQEHPRLALEPHVDVGRELERRLGNGDLDFAVVAGRSSHPEVLSRPLCAATFSWAATPRIIRTQGTRIGTLLRTYPLITLPQSAGTTRLLDDWLLAHKVQAPERLLCNSWAAIAGMLRVGVGVGFLPSSWLQPLQLQQLGKRTPLAPLQYSFQWKRGDARPLIPAMQHLAEAHVSFTVAHGLAST